MFKNVLTQLAQKINAGDAGIQAIGADQVLANALNIFYFLAGLTAVIVIIVGAINYTTSRGDAGLLTKAKNLIMYAVVGLVVVIAAFGITNFVVGVF